MTNNRQQPPSIYSKLFEWFCKDELFDELQGDLEEEFNQNLRANGEKRAKWIYKKEVLKMLRLSVIKRTNNLHHYYKPTIMFKNYSIVAFRNLTKNRLFSFINIIGLSISMAVGLIAITFVNEIHSYDSFHEKGDRIYRVVSDITRPNRGTSLFATAPLLAGKKLITDFTGVEKVALISRSLNGDFINDNNKISLKGIYTNNSFFDIFTFPLLYGNQISALSEPYSAILTETTALKLFGKTNVVGDLLEHPNGDQLKITGVVKNPPRNSHLQFDIIGSLKTLEVKKSWKLSYWGQITADFVYITVPEDQNLQHIQSNLSQMTIQENAKVKDISVDLRLERLNDIFTSNIKYNQFGLTMPKETINSIIVLALIVILSACFNYTNLSMARSLKRAKEVGVRKVVGARKSQLLFQFIMEAILVSLLALGISLFFFRLIRPEFLTLNYSIRQTTTLELTQEVYLYFLVFAIIVGALAGLLPALLMSKLKPVTIMKGASTIKVTKGIDLRKVLTSIQFTLSMGFLVFVSLAYKQYKYSLNFDLGFTTENILNIDIQNNDVELLKNTFSQVPEVTGISTSSMIPGTGSSRDHWIKYNNPLDSLRVFTFDVNPTYINNMKHQLIAGTNFDTNITDGKIIVNELLIERLGLGSAQEAIDKSIHFSNKNWTIIGVIKDFHDRKTDDPLAPFLFTSGIHTHYHLNVKLATKDITRTMAKLNLAWTTVDDYHDFEAMFYSEWIERAYSKIEASIKTYGLLAAIAISISILGLLGMAVYTTESKIKELTIRKVLGATVSNLVLLLSRNFMTIFIISAGIAIPVAYIMYQKTIVPNNVYKINVGFWELSSGALLIILIAFVTISSQTVKAAKSNPAENLRNE